MANKFMNEVALDITKQMPSLRDLNIQTVKPMGGMERIDALSNTVKSIANQFAATKQKRAYSGTISDLKKIETDTLLQIQGLGANWQSDETTRNQAIEIYNESIQQRKDILLNSKGIYDPQVYADVENYFMSSVKSGINFMQTKAWEGYSQEESTRIARDLGFHGSNVQTIYANGYSMNDEAKADAETVYYNNDILTTIHATPTFNEQQKITLSGEKLIQTGKIQIQQEVEHRIINNNTDHKYHIIEKDENGQPLLDKYGNVIYKRDLSGNFVENTNAKLQALVAYRDKLDLDNFQGLYAKRLIVDYGSHIDQQQAQDIANKTIVDGKGILNNKIMGMIERQKAEALSKDQEQQKQIALFTKDIENVNFNINNGNVFKLIQGMNGELPTQTNIYTNENSVNLYGVDLEQMNKGSYIFQNSLAPDISNSIKSSISNGDMSGIVSLYGKNTINMSPEARIQFTNALKHEFQGDIPPVIFDDMAAGRTENIEAYSAILAAAKSSGKPAPPKAISTYIDERYNDIRDDLIRQTGGYNALRSLVLMSASSSNETYNKKFTVGQQGVATTDTLLSFLEAYDKDPSFKKEVDNNIPQAYNLHTYNKAMPRLMQAGEKKTHIQNKTMERSLQSITSKYQNIYAVDEDTAKFLVRKHYSALF